MAPLTSSRGLPPAPLADFGPYLEGWAEPTAFGVGGDGSLYAVSRRPSAELQAAKDGSGYVPPNPSGGSRDCLVVCVNGPHVQTVTVPDVSMVVSYVQPCAEGVLLVAACCDSYLTGSDDNVILVDWHGRVVRSFTLGSGVRNVRVTADGGLWAAYLDEGVFGEGQAPPGAPGLVRFDLNGEVSFRYDAAIARTDSICDVYALNLSEDGAVWVYFFRDFPLVRVHEGTYRSWNLGVPGARAFALRADRVLLLGDSDEPNRARILALEGHEAIVVDEVEIQDRDGKRLGKATASGCGERLYIFKNRQALVVEGW